MEPIVNIAIKAARGAAKIIIKYLDQVDLLTVKQKAQSDFVTQVDEQAEQAIIQTIRQAYPEHGILAEESGQQASETGYQWIIDPLDGTTNYIHGFPHFAVSIAFQNKTQIEHAVIYDPLREELFTASYGKGARLNHRRIRVSQKSHLKTALLGTGFPTYDATHTPKQMTILGNMLPHIKSLRRAGAASLDLAYVASSRLDGFWEFGLKPWDIAAGILLVREAGGLVTDCEGGQQHLHTGNIVAANPKLFQALLNKIDTHHD